jgi:hypothetical protein
MTYRRDSTITTPYFKFLYYNQTLQNGIDLVMGFLKHTLPKFDYVIVGAMVAVTAYERD